MTLYMAGSGDQAIGVFYDEYGDGEFGVRAFATNGEISLTVTSADMGEPLLVSDAGAPAILSAGGAVVGSIGALAFDGNWSDPDPLVSPDPGIGSAEVFYEGVTLDLGTFITYAICYDREP